MSSFRMSKTSDREAKKVASIAALMDADPDFYRGFGIFKFPNGDSYEGDYIAHRNGLVWREGQGTYTTHDGQSYKGKWYSDKLVKEEECEITFQNGAKYLGSIDNCQYVGPAMYSVNHDLHILAEFSENIPVGQITLLDHKGREWSGTAGETNCILLPEHTFFINIPAWLGKGKQKIQREKSSLEKVPKIKRQMSLRLLEAKIFAKSKKTVSDLKFEDSAWYQNYMKFRNIYDEINEKIATIGKDALCQEERDWIEKYRNFKAKYIQIMNNRKAAKMKNLWEYQLFELYNDEEYIQKNMPVPVFYASGIESKEAPEASEEDEAYSDRVSVKFDTV